MRNNVHGVWPTREAHQDLVFMLGLRYIGMIGLLIIHIDDLSFLSPAHPGELQSAYPKSHGWCGSKPPL